MTTTTKSTNQDELLRRLGAARNAYNAHVNECEICTCAVVDEDLTALCAKGDELDAYVAKANVDAADGNTY